MPHPVRYLVPAVLAAAGGGALPALELTEGLTLYGFGEAFAHVEHRDAAYVRNTTGREDTWIDFPSDLELGLRYRIEDVVLTGEFSIASEDQFDDDNVLLEQAFVDWAATSRLTVRAGRFESEWLAWEGFDSPQLWRVRHSAAWDWNVQNHGLGEPRPFVTDGVGVRWREGGFLAEFYVCDDILGDGPGQRGYDKGLGGAVSYRVPASYGVELGLAFDPNSTADGDDDAADAFAVELNADCSAARDAGWFFAVECQVHRHPDLTVGGVRFGNDLVALAMANYAFKPGLASVTAMVDYVERGFAADDNEVMEYALALLLTPRKHVRLNTEVFYWDETAEEADVYGGAAVILVEIP